MDKDSKTINRANRQHKSGKRNKNWRREKEIADTAIDMMKSKTNDFSWYNNFPQITKDAGNLAFGLPLGEPVPSAYGQNIIFPGVMRIMYVPTIGYSTNQSSPINRSATRFYTFLRSVQRAAASYDAADIMMYLMAVDSCYSLWSLCRRAYGAAWLFTPLNKYYPRNLLQYMGFDPSIAENLAEFRIFINRFALELSSFTMPKNFNITKRHMWMNEGLYLDSKGTRAQTYVFCPEGFWKFNNTVTTGSQLDFVTWQTDNDAITLHTLAEVQALAESLISALRGDADTADISGDLYRAYGDGNIMQVVETPDMYSILPVYDETVLSQIENATLCGLPQLHDTDNPFSIRQDPSVNNGAIIFNGAFRGSQIVAPIDGVNYGLNPMFTYPGQFINMHKDSPSSEEVIEATRLVASVSSIQVQKESAEFRPTTYGADVVTRLWIGSRSKTNPGALTNLYTKTNGLFYNGTGATATTAAKMELISLMQAFDWAPNLWLIQQVSTTPYVQFNYSAFDVDNITWASYQQLQNMHEASMLSLFDVPPVIRS